MVTAFSSVLKGETRQRILRNGSQLVLWNDESKALPKFFSAFAQILFKKDCVGAERCNSSSSFGSCRAARLQQCVQAVSSTERTHLGDIYSS